MKMRYAIPLKAMAASAVLILSAAAAGQANAPALQALRGVERGQWELRERGAAGATKKVCVADPISLIQVRHGATACSRFVIDNQAKRATVHYTCPGAGHGRTTIRVESPTLIHIESQGIASNAPFNLSYEARRTGACG
jgi:hypothetical protein